MGSPVTPSAQLTRCLLSCSSPLHWPWSQPSSISAILMLQASVTTALAAFVRLPQIVKNTKCINGDSFCGPFLISRGFWIDAGQCVLDNDSPSDPQAWKRCALDLVCSANTIRSYINRFGKDCDGDQLVTCEDYVMIHKNGGWNCGKSLVGSKFWEVYQTCKNVVISRGLNI